MFHVLISPSAWPFLLSPLLAFRRCSVLFSCSQNSPGLCLGRPFPVNPVMTHQVRPILIELGPFARLIRTRFEHIWICNIMEPGVPKLGWHCTCVVECKWAGTIRFSISHFMRTRVVSMPPNNWKPRNVVMATLPSLFTTNKLGFLCSNWVLVYSYLRNLTYVGAVESALETQRDGIINMNLAASSLLKILVAKRLIGCQKLESRS